MRPEVNLNWFEILLRGKGNFIISVHMNSGEVKISSVKISFRSI